MQNDEVEQTEQSVSKIGKFNTADDLLKAYNALESEFTKRCQLVKELQTELELLRAQATADGSGPNEQTALDAANVAEGKESTPNVDLSAMPSACESAEKAAEFGVLDEVARNAAAYAELLSVVPEVMDACIARYKQRLIESPSVGSPSGMAVIVPAKRPKTLTEAKRLADSMLAMRGSNP